MMIYLQSIKYNLWELVVNGPHVPTSTIDISRTIENPPKDQDENDKKETVNRCKKHEHSLLWIKCRGI